MPPDELNNSAAAVIVKKLTPRLLAVVLIVALFSLTAVVAFALYRGGEVNLNGWTFSAPNENLEKVWRLEKLVAACEKENSKKDLRVEKCENRNLNSMPLERISRLLNSATSDQEITTRIQRLTIIENEYRSHKNRFTFKLFLLENNISKNGQWIATHFDSPEKIEVFKIIQEILRELDLYNGNIDGERLRTREALLKFQNAYNKKLTIENTENGTEIPVLQPLGYVGFKTLEALRGWYRKNAV